MQSRQKSDGIGSSVVKDGPGTAHGPAVVVANSEPAGHAQVKEKVAQLKKSSKDSRAKESDLGPKAEFGVQSGRTPEHPIQNYLLL